MNCSRLASNILTNPSLAAVKIQTWQVPAFFKRDEVNQSAELWNDMHHRSSPATNPVMHRVGFQSG